MEEQSVIHHTFVAERIFPKPLERVFAACADHAQKRRWFLEGESLDVEEFTMDFEVGGREYSRGRLKADTPFPGYAIVNDATYLDIVPGRRIVSASTMYFGDQRISISLITVELLPADRGTTLVLTNQSVFFEGADGPEMREGGWRKLLDQLAEVLAA